MKKLVCYLLFFSLLMTSCLVINSGSVSSGPLLNVSDKYVDVATGECKSFTVLGIGWMHKKRMILQAKADLFKKRPLRNGEYYANFSVDFTKIFFMGPLVYISKALVSAEVMRTKDTTSAPFSEEFKQKVDKNVQIKSGSVVESLVDDLVAGDSVYYAAEGKNYKLYKVGSADKEGVMLLAMNQADKNMFVSGGGVFFSRKTLLGAFKSGDNVMVEITDINNANVFREGTVVGIADESILVETKSGFHVLAPAKVKKRN